MNFLHPIRITFISLFMVIGMSLSAQIAFSPFIDSLKNEMTDTTLSILNKELSGVVPATIGGEAYTILSRNSYEPGNAKAAEYIYEHFEDYGLEVVYHNFGSQGENVVATQEGSLYPDQQYIICAHYDAMPYGSLAPGADDNASGVCAVLESARILSAFELPYTIKYIAFDEEEQGLIGSWAYANEAAANGDDILGVINLDMIAWDSDNDNQVSIATNTLSTSFTNQFVEIINMYEPEINHTFTGTTASDHAPFWGNGYQALLLIEDWGDFNNFYHTIDDTYENMNIPYFEKLSRASFAALASMAWNMTMGMNHDPLASGNYTEDRTAWLVVSGDHAVATGDNEPRLYYRADEGDFNHVTPDLVSQDTFYFTIPAQEMNTTVEYYFGVQDENAMMVVTLPGGGQGISPPGTIAPETYFSYLIADIYAETYCSTSLPKQMQISHMFDTISVDKVADIIDVNVKVSFEHNNIGDINLYLKGPDGNNITLSSGNGGSGNDYENTVFDDNAGLSIEEGSAPFTGSFKPEQPLEAFNESNTHGDWVLHIYDTGNGNNGILTEYCVEILYANDVTNIPEQELQGELSLNKIYPNPATNHVNIAFSLNAAKHIHSSIFDMTGREIATIADQVYYNGDHTIQWSSAALDKGMYFIKVQTNSSIDVEPLMIIK